MGSVTSDIKCPNCKYPRAYEDYYYKRGERFVFCERCGYHSADYMDSAKEGFRGYIWKHITPTTKPKGAYCIKEKGSGTSTISSIVSCKKLIAYVSKHKKDLQTATITKNIEGKWYKIDLLTGKQKLFTS